MIFSRKQLSVENVDQQIHENSIAINSVAQCMI